jgi:hypothetical protein
MDIGIGIDLNEWREQTCRMNEVGQTFRSGDSKKLLREQLDTVVTGQKGDGQSRRTAKGPVTRGTGKST